VLILLVTVLQIVAVLCASAQPAYAYVDPGSGLFALQIISTSFAGMIFLIRRRLHRLFRSMYPGQNSENGKQK
jgi:hypothetical protein